MLEKERSQTLLKIISCVGISRKRFTKHLYSERTSSFASNKKYEYTRHEDNILRRTGRQKYRKIVDDL